jgi:hypothetical protein
MHFKLLLVALSFLVVTGSSLPAQVQSLPLQWEQPNDAPLRTPGGGVFSPVPEGSGVISPLPRVSVSRAEPTVAAVIGGVIGAAVGYTAMSYYCANRSCEMGCVAGLAGGVAVGSIIGLALSGDFTPPTRRPVVRSSPDWRVRFPVVPDTGAGGN